MPNKDLLNSSTIKTLNKIELILLITSPDGKHKKEINLFYSDDGIPIIEYSNGNLMTIIHKTGIIWGLDKKLDPHNHTFTFLRSRLQLSCFNSTGPQNNKMWSVDEESGMKLVGLMVRM